MIAYIVRFVKRIGILIPGLLMAYVAVHNVFPTVDRYLPSDALAIVATYVITAYVLIPTAFRLIRIVLKPKHIPLYCTTPDGFANDPVNIGMVGTRAELTQAMTAAGWYQADPHTLRNMMKEVVSILYRRPYPNAPFSSLYLFGRSQDVGFELPVDDHPLHRHHVRFWASTYTTSPRYRDHVHFWQKHHKHEAPERILWVGAVSLDIGFAPIRHNAQITHMIHPDTNAEREFLATALQKTKLVQETRKITVGKPYQLRNRALTGYMNADGKMKICELKISGRQSR
jgi:hypothetical protein